MAKIVQEKDKGILRLSEMELEHSLADPTKECAWCPNHTLFLLLLVSHPNRNSML